MRGWLVAGALLSAPPLLAQGAGYTPGQVMSVVTALPSTCTTSALVVRSSDATLHICTSTNTWTQLGWSPNTVFPGGIVFIDTGTCPAGWTEVSGLNGRTVMGTVAANGNVGGTGGSDSVTPTFTGASVTSSAVSAGTPAGTNGASATSGNCAATNILAGTGSGTACKAAAPNLTVTAQTFTGSALGTHTHTTTATGTISAVDTRSAFERLIACKKT